MKKSVFLLILVALPPSVLLFLGGCIVPREISQSACLDPEYLRLKTIPIDSMTPRQYAYFSLKNKECEDAMATANMVHQQEVWWQENLLLDFAILVGIFFLGKILTTF